MNLFKSEKPFRSLVDVDELLQDTYLLVVELRQGGLGEEQQRVVGVLFTADRNGT
ncbi:hypothetical protein ACIPL1_09895 [Pseudomonas sp. NPDC090202]|uniref:hypothetical protein n=1 Tax=Pseudomonas sp. NPDC090202 TaxID=3364476 RepID=UPI00381F98E2